MFFNLHAAVILLPLLIQNNTMELLYLFIGLLTGGLMAFLWRKASSKRTEMLAQEAAAAKAALSDMEQENKNLYKINATLEAEKKAMQERLNMQKEELENVRKQLYVEFQVIANKIMDDKSKKLVDVNEEKLSNILNPLKEKIQLFEKKVEETYNNETREKASLRKELEQIVAANRQMSEEANKLTRALKGDSKTQGDWGEVQLEILLEKAGLQRGIHFRRQESFKTEEGANLRPDFVINLPEGKHFVIDCKVSLTSYENYFNAESETLREKYLQEHVNSLSRHIADLGSKQYHQLYGINPPDYVFLFVPIEPALTVALQTDYSLFDKALMKNVVLLTTSTLLATMRTISFIWKQENQRRNVLDIAKEGGALYDKFVGFVNDLINVGKKIDDAKDGYKDAMNKLIDSPKKGDTIVGRIERIKSLGADATKALPPSLLERIDD